MRGYKIRPSYRAADFTNTPELSFCNTHELSFCSGESAFDEHK